MHGPTASPLQAVRNKDMFHPLHHRAGHYALLVALPAGLYGPPAGLLAGAVLPSAAMSAPAAHLASPHALLTAWTSLSPLAFWPGFSRGGGWLAPGGVSAGFAVLAEGPVGLVLPAAVVVI